MRDAAHNFRTANLAAMPGADVPEVIEPGRWHRYSTNGRRGDTAGFCKLFDDLRGGVFGCFRSGISETWSAADRRTMTTEQRVTLARQVMAATAEREAVQRRQWAKNGIRIARVSAELQPLTPGDPVVRYLSGRGIGGVWPLPPALHLHPALPYWHEGRMLGRFPAMVVPMTSPAGVSVALHCTYLSPAGRKAEVPTVKKLTPTAGPLAGACIALYGPVRGCIGIAEGIETALAASYASSLPTVAAYCAGILAQWRWPVGVRRLVVFADNDEAGRKAAAALRVRAVAAGLRCEIQAPTTPGADWLDVWAARDARMDSERAA